MGFLAISRKVEEGIIIDERIKIVLLETRHGRATIGIHAPGMDIRREELAPREGVPAYVDPPPAR